MGGDGQKKDKSIGMAELDSGRGWGGNRLLIFSQSAVHLVYGLHQVHSLFCCLIDDMRSLADDNQIILHQEL